MIYPSIACNLDQSILQTALPLLESGKVQAIEWSFDALYDRSEIPDWFEALLQAFSEEGRLVGHGIFYSLFSGRWSPNQQKWLQHLEKVSQKYRFDHVTEHFGFMTGTDFHKGAPINIPFTPTTLALGQDRLKRISAACQCPVGLENLAFAYSMDEVARHGDFLAQLIAPVHGFIILDLHNLYCQMHNFSVDFDQIIHLYPLQQVREIHISGGSWVTPTTEPHRQIRRDTHDDAVPDMVFELLEKTIPLCPNLKFVVLEQLGTALDTPELQASFQRDFYRMEALLLEHVRPQQAPQQSFEAPPLTLLDPPFSDENLYAQQRALSTILEQSASVEIAQTALRQSPLAHSDWHIEDWQPAMLETAIHIAQKWK